MSEVAIRPETRPKVIYRSEVRVTPAGGGIKLVYLPHETELVHMGMHGAIAAHYKLPEGSYTPRRDSRLLGRCDSRLPAWHAR